MDTPPAGTPLDLVTMLGRQVALRVDAPCVIFRDEVISFAEMGARSDRSAAALKAANIAPGERVVILATASPIFFELLFACAKAGVIMVPINARLSGREVAEVIADAEPALVFVSAELADLLPASVAQKAITVEAFAKWRDAASAGTSTSDAACAVKPDDPVLILYTSGTTAQAKGVVLSHRNLSYLGKMATELWSFTSDSANLVSMPLFHIGGIGYGLLALSQGGATIITTETEPDALIGVMIRHAITHSLFVPTVIQRLVDYLDASKQPPPGIEHMFYGAAPIGEALLRRAMAAFGSQFHHTYGMTETAGTVVTLPPEDHDPDGPHANRLRSCGRPMPWVELTLVDPATGREVGVDEIGEIRVRSEAITKGYWRKPEQTAEAITKDGWLCSGDAAVRDADGYIYLRDRYKNMIVSGGENIYPAEIENVLQHHPAIREVAVVGVPHPKWGETPKAHIVLRPDFDPSEADIIDFARERLARYKCPTIVVFVDDLPRNASGKILKRMLQE